MREKEWKDVAQRQDKPFHFTPAVVLAPWTPSSSFMMSLLYSSENWAIHLLQVRCYFCPAPGFLWGWSMSPLVISKMNASGSSSKTYTELKHNHCTVALHFMFSNHLTSRMGMTNNSVQQRKKKKNPFWGNSLSALFESSALKQNNICQITSHKYVL